MTSPGVLPPPSAMEQDCCALQEDCLADAANNSRCCAEAVDRIVLLKSLPARCVILLIRAYQILLSPFLGRNCRFHPTCSRYFILSVEKHGVVAGSWLGLRRLCRCHPLNPGGYDPPK